MIQDFPMPWGKFKGKLLCDCPSSYLKWIATDCDWDDRICEAADEEWHFRENMNKHWEE